MQVSVISIALDKLVEAELPNLQLLHVDGSELTNYFADSEVDQIYLNFSDPWPKKKHEKRRLTSPSFLAVDEEIYDLLVRFILKLTIKDCSNTH